MSFLHILVLSLVQGITEFLPISSSAHLILVPQFTDWPDQGPLIDVAAHVGTLLAVILYFNKDVLAMVTAVLGRRDERAAADRRLFWYVVVATIPLGLAGLAFYYSGLSDALRSMKVIGWTMLGFGIVLYAADRLAPTERNLGDMRLGGALVFGFAQILALVPGTSRSGVTITAGRLLGLNRVDAARFSMLMSITAIMSTGLLAVIELIRAENVMLGMDALLVVAITFLSALLVLWVLMRWLQHGTFLPFVVYRVLFGILLLVLAYS